MLGPKSHGRAVCSCGRGCAQIGVSTYGYRGAGTRQIWTVPVPLLQTSPRPQTTGLTTGLSTGLESRIPRHPLTQPYFIATAYATRHRPTCYAPTRQLQWTWFATCAKLHPMKRCTVGKKVRTHPGSPGRPHSESDALQTRHETAHTVSLLETPCQSSKRGKR